MSLTPTPDVTGHSYIGTEHILLGLLREGEGIAARVLESMGADSDKIRHQVCRACPRSSSRVRGCTHATHDSDTPLPCQMYKLCHHIQVVRMVGESQEPVGAGVGGAQSSNKTPTLEEYGTNLTKQAEEVRSISN